MESYAIRDLNFSYPEQSRKTLDGLSLSIHSGEFVTLCGPSGCGKTTLLRQLKSALAPHGVRTGEILFEGQPLETLDLRQQSSRIGFVLQSPDNQIVTDKVWHELAFGLESLGCETPVIRRKVAEMASFFGIENWFYKDVSQLSGGQKQLLNLAAIMAMQPSVLILDEPTSQLDPIAAADFLATVGRINRELGTTVILTEHRLEEVFPLSHRVLVMDEGRLLCDGAPQQVGQTLKDAGHQMFLAMPTPMRIYAAVPNDQSCPVTVREGRDWLQAYSHQRPLGEVPAQRIPSPASDGAAIQLSDVWFRYEKDAPDVVKGLNLSVYPGQLLTLLGGNGTGKSTTLSLVSGVRAPYRGSVRIEGKPMARGQLGKTLAVLPQNPQALFVKSTVGEDLLEILRESGLSRQEQADRVSRMTELCHLQPLLTRHPYDLSGGEQQRAALAKVLLQQPRILLLDEPTKGLDSAFKQEFAVILQSLLESGVAILMVSHDIEFCARYAHRCALFFDGAVVAEDTPRAFFGGNSFYTTAANRMARQLLPEAVTAEDVIAACGGTVPPPPPPPDTRLYPRVALDELKSQSTPPEKKMPRLPLWRKCLALLSGAVGLLTAASAVFDLPLPFLSALTELQRDGVMLAALTVLAAAVSRKADGGSDARNTDVCGGKLPRRTIAAAVMILLAIPLTIFIGYYFLGDRKYYFISLLILLETMLPFFMVFEGRKPQARELILIAVLCAIGVAARAAFFMLPGFKPVTAVVIIAAVAFGGESGFLVGALTMLLSNMYFQQGPWTPWQMFAMGIIGFLAGVLYRKGLLRRGRTSLCVFGGLSTLLIYGGIMNPAAMLMYQPRPSWPMLLTYYLQGVPVDLVHAGATVLFLWFFSQPMLEKLDRVKVKYGLRS